MNFRVHWSDGLDTLTDVMGRAAGAYWAVDAAAAGSLKADPAEQAVDGG
ncbi:hypothetical protein [Amycolatopsis sp. NBC_01286]|nr:hypothetical protein OG570_13370 [Amycolatopsis sp. NBC_01286]